MKIIFNYDCKNGYGKAMKRGSNYYIYEAVWCKEYMEAFLLSKKSKAAFCFHSLNVELSIEILKQTEKDLKLKDNSIFIPTKKAVFVKPSKFWLRNKLTVSLFLILCRSTRRIRGEKYFEVTDRCIFGLYKRNIKRKVAFSEYDDSNNIKSIIKAFEVFFDGHTEITKRSYGITSGWINTFSNSKNLKYLKLPAEIMFNKALKKELVEIETNKGETGFYLKSDRLNVISECILDCPIKDQKPIYLRANKCGILRKVDNGYWVPNERVSRFCNYLAKNNAA